MLILSFLTPVSLLLVVLLLAVAYWFLVDDRYDKSIPILPYALPYVGHLFMIRRHKDDATQWLSRNLLKHRKLHVRLPYPVGMVVLISDPEDLKFVLADDFKNWRFPVTRQYMGKLLFGKGIFMADGDLWSMQRGVAKVLFKKNNIKYMATVFEDESHKLVDLLNQCATSGEPIDIQNTLFKRLTLDSFVRVAFGVELNSLTKDVPFCNDFDWSQEAIEKMIFDIMWKVRYQKQYEQTVGRIDDFVFDLIAKRKSENYKEMNDFLSILIQAQESEENKVSDRFLRDMLINFLIAGRDTTACLLSWTFYFLSLYPDVERKVVDEIESCLGSERPSYDNVDQLKYLRNVLDETLRIYPPAVALSGRACINEVQLPSGGRIPAGGQVHYAAYATHRLPEYWGDDAEEFNPSRFDKPLKHPYQFIPFQRGPRICMGMDMAYIEAKIVIVSIIQARLKIRVLPGQDLSFNEFFPIILTAKNGMKAKIEKLK